MILNDADMLYIYTEIIKQIEPKSILDIGMIMKRYGAISRQVITAEIPKSVWFVGVDYMPEVDVPIYHEIYDAILDIDEVMKQYDNQKFELIYALDLEKKFSGDEQKRIWNWLKTHALHIVTNQTNLAMFGVTMAGKSVEVGNVKVQLLSMK